MNDELKFKRQPLRLDLQGQRRHGYQPPWRKTPRPNKTAGRAAATLAESMEGRICRPAAGLDCYLATECGRIISLLSGRLLGGAPSKKGYYAMRFSTPTGRKPMYFHAIIAETFLGPRPSGSEVNHRDGDKLNNAVSNLEYISKGDNVRHAYRTGLNLSGVRCPWAKLTEDQVREVRALAPTMRQCQIARHLNLKPAAVSNIIRGKKWRRIS